MNETEHEQEDIVNEINETETQDENQITKNNPYNPRIQIKKYKEKLEE